MREEQQEQQEQQEEEDREVTGAARPTQAQHRKGCMG